MKTLETTIHSVLNEAKSLGKTDAANDIVIELRSVNARIQTVSYFLGSKSTHVVSDFVADRGGPGGKWVKDNPSGDDTDLSKEKKEIGQLMLKAATQFDQIVAKEMKARGYRLN